MSVHDNQQRTGRRWPLRLLRALLIYGGIPYVSITILLAVLQRRLMYYPTVAADLSVAQTGLDSATTLDVRIDTSDGQQLKGWLIRSAAVTDRSGAPPLVLYFPGNAGNRRERQRDLQEIADCGGDVLICDYRGYGDSPGHPSEAALASDARLIWQYAVTQLHYDPDRIVLFGESLGGAVALSMWSGDRSTYPRPAAVILNSTFASMSGVVEWHYPWLPVNFLLLDRWRSVDWIPRVESPIIIFHGTADDIVPLSQGQLLSRQSRHARLIQVPGGTHNSIPMESLRQELQKLFADLSARDGDSDATPPP